MITKTDLRKRFTERVNDARIARDWFWTDLERKAMLTPADRIKLCTGRMDPTRELAVTFAAVFGESQDEWLWALGFTPTWWMEFGVEHPEIMTEIMNSAMHYFKSPAV